MNRPQEINKTISYQEGAVVSREIVNKPTGTVTLFAFAQNQGVSEHTTSYDALVVITDGVAEITVAGVKHEVKNGEMLLMPVGVPHALKAPQPFKMMLIMIKS